MIEFLSPGWCIQFFIGFAFWRFCSKAFEPPFIASNHINSHHIGEQLVRVVTFCHACMCSIFAVSYLLGFISSSVMILGRIYSTAFFFYDAIQALSIYNRARDLGIEKHLKHPAITLFHHLVTTCLMYGFMFQNQLTGLVMFYLAEIAMLPVLITWRYIHINQEFTPECAMWRGIEIFLYFFLRVLIIPPLFFSCVIPYFEHHRILAWPILIAYILVYVLNVLWFIQLALSAAQKTGQEYLIKLRRMWTGKL